MVYISLTTAFRYRGKGHLAYYRKILHDSLALSSQLPSRKGWAGPFMITLTMPRQSNWNATDRGLRAYDRSGWSVTNNYPLILYSYNNIQASFRKLLVQSI